MVDNHYNCIDENDIKHNNDKHMILGSLSSTEKYEDIHPRFKKAFDYLRQTDFATAEVGTVELMGKDLFVIISDSNLKKEADAKLEMHRKYIDIQMPISKAETFGWKSKPDLKQPSEDFDPERDIQFFEDSVETFLTVAPNDFVVFFPIDAHAPCIGEGQVRKVVVKVKLGR